jgi:hypothetical protein
MKVLFAGPSLADELPVDRKIAVRDPARQGDLARAVADGATAIGLVDGVFEAVAAVWHKEILYALSEGVRVCGAASMGALRAAECAAYGMVGIGRVFEAYASGALVDDAAVAQLHAPAELGHGAITEALVNIEATLEHLSAGSLIDRNEGDRLRDAARSVFFKERTYERILEAAAGLTAERRAAILALTVSHRRDVKREDARRLIAYLRALPDDRGEPPPWRFVESPMWRAFHGSLAAASST